MYRDERRKRASLFLSKLDFKCGFGKDGKCRGKRGKRGDSYTPWYTCEQGCCKLCGEYKGYLAYDRFKELKKEHGFTEKRGFWTPLGCSLPHEERSRICLIYSCQFAREHQSQALKQLLYNIEYYIVTNRTYLSRIPWSRKSSNILKLCKKYGLEKIDIELVAILCRTTVGQIRRKLNG